MGRAIVLRPPSGGAPVPPRGAGPEPSRPHRSDDEGARAASQVLCPGALDAVWLRGDVWRSERRQPGFDHEKQLTVAAPDGLRHRLLTSACAEHVGAKLFRCLPDRAGP